ncbi:cytokine receptor common subunit gamma-like [Plectropomus leopardus]|uniref:cytokine receptor common subunit gamma-like n=1 Tax=Plectropomus leopardus TaxID=160734 RepID=UPI001C4A8138|nr:cytokine receptor common subunit gamma-like [Plectropomus leopardus]
MLTRLLLLYCLTGHVFSKEPPDMDCLVVHLKYVHCSWNKQGTPQVNYTFYGWFQNDKAKECPSYLSEKNITTGCNQPYENPLNRFSTFHTKLEHGNTSFRREYNLKEKVKLNPPTNLTVQNRSDSNLWLSWTQISPNCVDSEVRYRINNRNWATSRPGPGTQNYCINLPSHNSLYELQVRSKITFACGDSDFWSDWSEPVFWGSNNSTAPNPVKSSTSVWTPVLYVVGAFILILLVMMLLHHERIRIIFIPVVPKPSAKLHNPEDWFQFPKGLKESFNYNERPCPVREYCHVPQTDSESSDCSTCSATTDQTNCSVLIPGTESDLTTPCSSSTSTVTV